jgi:hypothetical protein
VWRDTPTENPAAYDRALYRQAPSASPRCSPRRRCCDRNVEAIVDDDPRALDGNDHAIDQIGRERAEMRLAHWIQSTPASAASAA